MITKLINRAEDVLRYVYNRKRDRSLLMRDIKFLKQRIVRGWDDSETWSLDYTVAKFMLPRLIRFKQISCAKPYNLTDAEWDFILNEMIYFLQYSVDWNEGSANCLKKYGDTSNEFSDRYQKAKELFGEYFDALWW